MQLTTVGRAIWQGAKEARRLAEAKAGDPEVGKRLHTLKLVKALRESKRSWEEIAVHLGQGPQSGAFGHQPGHLRRRPPMALGGLAPFEFLA